VAWYLFRSGSKSGYITSVSIMSYHEASDILPVLHPNHAHISYHSIWFVLNNPKIFRGPLNRSTVQYTRVLHSQVSWRAYSSAWHYSVTPFVAQEFSNSLLTTINISLEFGGQFRPVSVSSKVRLSFMVLRGWMKCHL